MEYQRESPKEAGMTAAVTRAPLSPADPDHPTGTDRPTDAGGRAHPHADRHRIDVNAARAKARALVKDVRPRRVRLPVLGQVTLPPPDRMAYFVGLGILAAVEIIEWPLALVIGAGHLLADQHWSRVLHGFGEAAEEA
jgi:hypothetical protein